MANFCNWKNIEDEAANYNAMVEEDLMDQEMFEGFFTDLSSNERNEILSKAYNAESNTWNYLYEDTFQNNNSEEESPVPTGDPSMDLTQAAEYNSFTATAHKMRISRNLRSLYAINQLTDEFRDAVYSRCVFDYNNPTARPSVENISKTLNTYKYELVSWLNETLGLGISIANGTDTELNTSIHEVMNAAAEHLDDISLSTLTQLDVKKAFYKLAYFENLLNDLEIVTRKKSVAEYDNTWDMYDPKFGKDKVFAHTFSQDDGDLDMDQISTPFIKEFFNYLPLINSNGEPDKKLKVGWNGFQRAMTAFMSWAKTYADPDLYEDITNGKFEAVQKGLETWLKSGQTVGSIYNSGVNEDITRSILKYVFGDPYTTVPENIKNIIYTQVVKTAKRAYLSYDYEAKTKSITLDVIEDKAIISESSHLTNVIIGRVKQIRKDQSLRESLFGKDGKIKNLNIETTASTATNITFDYTSSTGETKNFSFNAQKTTDDKGNILKWDFNINEGNNVDEFTDDIVFDLIYDLFGYNLGLPENIDDKQVIHNFLEESLGGNKSILDVFKDPICLVLLGGEKTLSEANGFKFKYYDAAETTIDLRNYFKNYDDLAKFLYWCTGYDSKNVVRDIKGDKIPVYGLVSAIMQYPTLLYKAKKAINNTNSVYHHIATTQPLLNGDLQIGDPLIRNGISTSTGQKSASDMSESEIVLTSAFVDYGQSLLFDTNKKIDGYRGHRFMDGATVFIQPTVFSDKSQQFVLPFTFNGDSEILKSLKNLAKGNPENKTQAEQYLTKYIFDWQSRKYRSLIEQVYNKYARVYKDSQINAVKLYKEDGSFNLATINLLEDLIARKASNIELMRAEFEEAGEDLVPEMDYSKNGNKYGLNQAIKYKALSVFASEQSTANYLEVQKRLLVQDIVNNNINLYDNILKVTGLPEEWTKNGQITLYKIYKVDTSGNRSNVPSTFDERIILLPNGEINPEYEIELNPILNSWIYGDGICSQSWEEIFFGLNENNPNKSDGGNEAEVAGRLLAHYKRTVPAGSTVHLYQQGRLDGVPQNFRIACVDDANFIYATNPAGEVYGKDPHDGGALINPYMAILARNSLGTAADGIHQAKTILHDVDEYGNGMLCKWATYTISHAMRRAGQGAKFNLEKLHKKMNLVPLNVNFLKDIFNTQYKIFKEKFGNTYMWDVSLNSNVVISDIQLISDTNGTRFEVTKKKCNEYGKPIDNVEYISRFGGSRVTLYNLDQALGGAYFKLQNSNHKLEYSEQSDEFVAEILSKMAEINFDYRSQLISYLVNTSAIKRGQKNTNSSETLENEEEFRTTMISSKMGGLMMATEHDVDGHVREMSQIMASLTQKGYTNKQARKIYSDIAKIIEVTANDLFDGTALTEEKRKEIIENYLVKSLDNSSSKGIGASDAITLYAKEDIKDKDGNIKRLLVPFSLPDIRSKFLSVVNAYLTNEAIIRQYPGIQAVNTPSRGMIQYYTINGQSYDYEAASRKVHELISEDEVNNLCDFFEVQEEDPEFRKNLAVDLAFKPYSSRNKWSFLADIIQNITGVRPASKIATMQFVEDYKYLSLEELLDPEREFRSIYKNATNEDILLFNEIRNSKSDEIIDDICDGQFARKILNQHSLRIGQTILVRYRGQIDPITGETIPGSNDQTYKKVILESGYQRDIWANLINPTNWDIYVLDLAPEDLKQPRMNFTVSYGQHKETTDEMDLDAVRVMFYYRELTNSKMNPQYKIKKQALVDKVFAKILSFGNKYQFSRKLQNLVKAHEETNAKLKEKERKPFNVYDPNVSKQMILIFREYQQEIYRQFKLHKKLTKNDEILGDQEAFASNLDWEIKFNQIDAGEIAISAAYAKEFNLEEGDDLGEILDQGVSFFEKRIKQKVDPSIFANKSDYDLILTDNLGNQTLVKINKGDWSPVGDDGNCLFVETSEEVEKQPVNTTYKGRKICSNEEWRSKNIKIGRIAKSSNSPSMKMIVLEDINDLALFEDSGLFNTKETIYNYTENNVNDLWDHFKETLKLSKNKKSYILPAKGDTNKQKIDINSTGRDVLGKLQNFEKDKADRYVSRTAEKMFKHFEDTLLYFGTRIPSQALQSGMALKVKMFVGTNSNQVFIPGAMHWFEGADYDIDKTYMMRLGLVNGKIDVLSDLYDDFGAKCSELPVPNSKNTYTVSVENNVDPFISSGVNQNGGKWYYSGVNYINASELIDGSNHNFNNDKMFEVIKTILENSENDPTGSGNIVVIQDLPVVEEADLESVMETVQDYAEYLEDALKTHNKTKLTSKRRVSTGLMNKNVINAREILLDPETFLSASDPISFGILKDFAKKSTLGGREKTVSIWNGMTKAIMQSQFQLGKKEIGIIATAIKTFLMKTSVVNDAVNRAASMISQGNFDEALNILSKYVYEVVDLSGQQRLALLANINFQPLYDALTSDTVILNKVVPEKFKDFIDQANGQFKAKEFLDTLSSQDAEYDVLMALSSLLSAATDRNFYATNNNLYI